MDWMEFKLAASDVGLDKDALHIYAAFAIQIAAALLTKRSLAHWLPWLCVLALALVNEGLDLWLTNEIELQAWQLLGSIHDMVNTMILPTALLLLCRSRWSLGLPHSPAD